MTRLRIGLIGTGKHGRRYALHIRDDLPQLQLVALSRRNEQLGQQAAEEFRCRYVADYHELIESPEVDAVVVVVPAALHVDVVSAAARAGKPVLLEKPAAVSLDEGRRMLAALREHTVPVMVAQTLRYNAVVRAFLERREEIGPVHSLALTQRFERSSLEWLDDPSLSGGGIILHTGVHSFDLLRIASGYEADELTCSMQSLYTRRTEDSFAASIRLGGGRALATVCGSRAAPGRTGYVEIAGERATFVGDHVANQARIVVGVGGREIPLGAPVLTVREVLRAFSGAILSGSSMPIPLEEGLRAVAIAEACYRAARACGPAVVETC